MFRSPRRRAAAHLTRAVAFLALAQKNKKTHTPLWGQWGGVGGGDFYNSIFVASIPLKFSEMHEIGGHPKQSPIVLSYLPLERSSYLPLMMMMMVG